MKAAFVVSALLGAAFAAEGDTPAGCSTSYDGQFQISVAQITTQKRDLLEDRATCGTDGSLTLTLADGILLDGEGRTGYIASNFQFQFDNPPQAGTIYADGWSVCSDNELALGANKTFYRCLSGNFYNLYNEDWAAQCEPISILVVPCGSSASVSQGTDGQIIGTTVVATTIITALPDGQPQVITTSVSVPIYTTYSKVTQISDGQIQAPTSVAAPVTQISDGQIQAPTATGAPVTQISDGQIQAPTTVAPVTQISDGQIQAPTSTAAVVTQISDGQIQAPTSSSPASATVSTVPVSGSSRSGASSAAALLLGAVVAFLCL